MTRYRSWTAGDRRTLHALVVCLLAISMVGCGSPGTPGGGTSDGVTDGPTTHGPTTSVVTSPPSSSPVFSAPASLVPAADACADGFTDLALQPETEVEAWLAPSIRVCEGAVDAAGNPAVQLQVINAGPAVWVVDQVPGWSDKGLVAGGVVVSTFRTLTQGTYDGVAVEPGQQAFINPSADFSLHLAPNAILQATWETISRLVDAARSRVEDAALARLTPNGRALVACAQQAPAVWSAVTDVRADTPPDDALDSLYSGVLAADSCRTAIDTARDENVAAGRKVALETDDLLVRSVASTERVERSGLSLVASAVQRGIGLVIRSK